MPKKMKRIPKQLAANGEGLILTISRTSVDGFGGLTGYRTTGYHPKDLKMARPHNSG
jgi:hypothetical protein